MTTTKVISDRPLGFEPHTPAALASAAGFVRFVLAWWLVLATFALLVNGAENAAPVNATDGGYIREWLVSGPFPSDDIGTDYLTEFGGESIVQPKEGDVVAARNGMKLVWKRYRSTEDYVMLEHASESDDHSMA